MSPPRLSAFRTRLSKSPIKWLSLQFMSWDLKALWTCFCIEFIMKGFHFKTPLDNVPWMLATLFLSLSHSLIWSVTFWVTEGVLLATRECASCKKINYLFSCVTICKVFIHLTIRFGSWYSSLEQHVCNLTMWSRSWICIYHKIRFHDHILLSFFVGKWIWKVGC